jgi:vitamin B12 transporter
MFVNWRIIMPALALQPLDSSEIVITASRVPEEKAKSAASSSVIDMNEVRRLGDPLASSFLRLTPSAAVESNGPAGTFTEVRIRGAEANHTLLFIDGIRANDPAANDTPRFELLNADLVSRIEVVRGPQSALWGSDAIGGVIAVNGVAEAEPGYSAAAEAGSFAFRRASASATFRGGRTELAGAVGWQRAAGIDSFDGHGDKDGYRNLAGRVRASWQFAPRWEAGISGFSLSGRSQFDGFNPEPPFQHMDTLDSTRNRLSAGRLWVSGGSQEHGLSGTVSASLLFSSNRNFLADNEINETAGRRWTAAAQVQYRFATGRIAHTAIVAADHDRETFRASDAIFFGASDQRRHRSHDALTGEWRAELSPLTVDLAVRRDMFSAFADATTARSSLLAKLGGGLSIAASYSEGIAQPTFFDLFGVFPGNFVGNPSLKPESSRGYEASIRYRRGALDAALTGYKQKLRDEIVDVFDPLTFESSTVNRSSASHRSGIEAELGWRVGERLHVRGTYGYLHATEPGAIPSTQLREVRRPKHSASIEADGASGRLTYGASVAYVGARGDTDFEVFPARAVRLKPYWLAGGRIGFSPRPGLELFVRGSNLFDARYQDVVGYRTEGRAIYAGLRIGGR